MNTSASPTSEKTDVSDSTPQLTKSAATEFSPISGLFHLSLTKLKPVVKHLIGLEVILMITVVTVMITFGIMFGVSLVSTEILNNLDSVRDPMQLPGILGTLLQSDTIGSIILVVVLAGITMTWLSLVFTTAFILRLDKSNQVIPFSQFLKDGVAISSSLFLLSLLIGVISIGATIVLIIPGIIASVVLSFAVYEVILQRTSITAALKNSYAMITNHFLQLFVRVLVLLIVVVVINAFFEFLAGDKNNVTSMFVQFIGMIVSTITGWFSLAYTLIVYREARAQTNLEKPKNPTWLYIVSGLGWIVLLILGSYLWSMRAEIIEGMNSLYSGNTSESYLQMIDGESDPSNFENMLDEKQTFPIEQMIQENGELNQAEFETWLQQYQEENQLTE